MVEGVVIVVLAMLVLIQHWVYAKQTQKLLDKLMSRNYHEYQVSKQLSEPKAPQSESLRIPIDDGTLDELNRLTGGVGPL